jgi:hypothetical protein
MAGRKPEGSQHARKYKGSQEGKKRLEVILKTLAGEMKVEEACRILGIKEALFHRLRTRGVVAMGEALERKAGGPPKKETEISQEEFEKVKRENLQLKLHIRGQQIREEMAILMPEVIKKARESQKKTAEPELDLFPEGRWRAGGIGTGKKSKKR